MIGVLTPAQARTLCDWSNERQGGYGRSVTCSGTTQRTDVNQDSCVLGVVAAGSRCPTLTVGDAEDCMNATGTDLCAFGVATACATLRACTGG